MQQRYAFLPVEGQAEIARHFVATTYFCLDLVTENSLLPAADE